MTAKPPFDQLVRHHGARVWRVCRAVLGPVDADDAWSETFLAALRAYPELPSGADHGAWLATIAYRKAVLPPASKTVPTTWGQDVSPALNRPRGVNAGATVRVYQGVSSDKEFKFE